MKVTIKFNTHTNKGEDCGVLDIKYSNSDVETKEFTRKEWKAFRVGAGRGAKATQEDFKAFVGFISDQGLQQYRETFTNSTAWSAMVKRCYY